LQSILTENESLKSELYNLKYNQNMKEQQINEKVQKVSMILESTDRKLLELNNRSQILEKIIKNNNTILCKRDNNIIIDTADLGEDTDKSFIYKLPQRLKNVSSIELKSFNFPRVIYNITPYNNVFCFIIEDQENINNNEDMNDVKNESSIVLSDSDREIKKNNKSRHPIKVSVPPGEYDIENLIKKMHSIKKKYDISMTYNKYTKKVTIKHKQGQKFSFYNGNNSIISILGFHESEYEGKSSYIGESPYDLRSERYVMLYLNNINDHKPFAKIPINSKNMTQRIDFKQNINELDHLEIELLSPFTNKSFYFDQQHYMLNFNIISLEETSVMMKDILKNILEIDNNKLIASQEHNEVFPNNTIINNNKYSESIDTENFEHNNYLQSENINQHTMYNYQQQNNQLNYSQENNQLNYNQRNNQENNQLNYYQRNNQENNQLNNQSFYINNDDASTNIDNEEQDMAASDISRLTSEV
jgi:hypothetical protein